MKIARNSPYANHKCFYCSLMKEKHSLLHKYENFIQLNKIWIGKLIGLSFINELRLFHGATWSVLMWIWENLRFCYLRNIYKLMTPVWITLSIHPFYQIGYNHKEIFSIPTHGLRTFQSKWNRSIFQETCTKQKIYLE